MILATFIVTLETVLSPQREIRHIRFCRYVERFVASINTSPQNVGHCEKSLPQSHGLHTGLLPLLKLMTSQNHILILEF